MTWISAAFTDTRVLPIHQCVRPERREPIVILPTPERVTRTAMHDSQYDSEEEVGAWFAQEVAIEFKDFVDEIFEESPEAIQITTETP